MTGGVEARPPARPPPLIPRQIRGGSEPSNGLCWLRICNHGDLQVEARGSWREGEDRLVGGGGDMTGTLLVRVCPTPPHPPRDSCSWVSERTEYPSVLESVT